MSVLRPGVLWLTIDGRRRFALGTWGSQELLEMAEDDRTPTPSEQIARLYEQAESQAEKASERVVGSGGFVSLLGQLAENAAALTRLSSDAMDLVIRNLRVAGRRDVTRLARQLARTEDKLERVLQELEDVRDELQRQRTTSNSGSRRSSGSSSGSGRSAGSNSGSRRSSRQGGSSGRSGGSNGSTAKARKTSS